MPEVSDVDLMQLADGTLAGPKRKLIEAELAIDPELQERLEVFRATGKVLAKLFDPIIAAPLPPSLLEALDEPGSPPVPYILHLAPRAGRAKGGTRFADALNVWPFSSATACGAMAWAAVAAVVIGLGAASWFSRSSDLGVEAATPFALALERAPSRHGVLLDVPGRGAGTLEPDLSFRHVDGRYCRQYEMRFGAGGGIAGYACRVGESRWQVEKEAELEVAVPKLDREGEIRPSGNSGTAAIEAAIDNVIVGDVLEASRELELIRSGWLPEGQQ